jgi:hypothetical protein
MDTPRFWKVLFGSYAGIQDGPVVCLLANRYRNDGGDYFAHYFFEARVIVLERIF